MSTGIERGRATDLRVIVSFESRFHAYRGTLAAAIRILRPDAEVITIQPEEMGEATKRFVPDVVVGSPLKSIDVDGVPAWVDLSLDPAQSSRVSVNGCYSEIVNPTLDRLLAIIEEVAPSSRKEADW